MKTNTFEQILEILRKSKHPFVYLYLRKDSFSAPFVGSFECETLPDGATLEQKLKAAETWLINFLETSFEGENTFLIEMKMHTRANGNGIIGALPFTYGAAKSQGINGIEQTNNVYNPQSLQALGYIPESEVNYRLLKQELSFKDLLHQKELQDLTREYKETLEAVKEQSNVWTPESIQSIVKEISGIAGILLNKNKAVEIPMQGTNEPEKKPSAKDVIINKSVEKLQDLSLNEIVVLNKLIDDFKQTIELNKQKQSEQTQTEQIKTETNNE